MIGPRILTNDEDRVCEREIVQRDCRLADTEAGPLCVLFDRDASIAFHLAYGRPVPHAADLRTLQPQLTATGSAIVRLLVADFGWLLATDGCDPLGLQLLLQMAALA